MTLAACSGRTKTLRTETPAATPAAPRTYTYRVIESYPHSTDSYTQGLLFADGVMWEGTGEYGHSRLQRIDLETGRTDVVATLPRSEFGEGIALLDGKIYQLTWENNKAYVYDAATGRQLRTFAYAGEGWGLPTDGERLYMSDGSEYLRILDPETFRVQRSVPVTFRGAPVQLLNELEWIEGRIWANLYLYDQVVVIDPQTGEVTGVVDFEGLQEPSDRTPETDVFNGIAYDAASGDIYVTGKNWNKLYKVEIFEKEKGEE